MENNYQLKPVCPHNEFCGGCMYQGMSYDEHLSIKENQTLEYFRSKEVVPLEWEGIVPCPEGIYQYRNKMEYTFGDLVKDGDLTLGMHKKGHFMSIVTVDQCQLVTDDYNKILKCVLDFAISREYSKYNKKLHTGFLRNLIIRRGVRTKELLVNLVTSSQEELDCNGLIAALMGLQLDDSIVGIIHTINDNMADAVNVEKMHILWGRDFYIERIGSLTFKVSAFSFFQTNVVAAERLYMEATSLIPNLEGKTVFDLYCGTGTISQIVAGRAKRVVGVELVEDAVLAARENAELNGITNCEFISGDVYKVLSDYHVKPDVIVVDPPRMGMTDKAVDKIASYGVPEILYISCNPKTLAINLAQFAKFGYEFKYGKAYDNFPMTKHVESVVLMTRVAPTII